MSLKSHDIFLLKHSLPMFFTLFYASFINKSIFSTNFPCNRVFAIDKFPLKLVCIIANYSISIPLVFLPWSFVCKTLSIVKYTFSMFQSIFDISNIRLSIAVDVLAFSNLKIVLEISYEFSPVLKIYGSASI